jgi:hypothetical protein
MDDRGTPWQIYSEILTVPFANCDENSSNSPPTTVEDYCVRRGLKMKKDDARLAVLRGYDRWAKAHPSKAKEMGGFVFFRYLEKEKPDLLDFRGGASKWQIVHLWLRHGGRLED